MLWWDGETVGKRLVLDGFLRMGIVVVVVVVTVCVEKEILNRRLVLIVERSGHGVGERIG